MPEILYEVKRQGNKFYISSFSASFQKVYADKEDTDFSGHNKICNLNKGITAIVEQGNKGIELHMEDGTEKSVWERLRDQVKENIERETGYILVPVGER